MALGWIRLTVFVAAAAAVMTVGQPARAERPRVVVLPVTGSPAGGDLGQRVGQALSEGLLASGADVAPLPERFAAPALEACATPHCLAELAAAAQAAFVLRASMELEGRSYTFRLEMLDGQSGESIATREDHCDICAESEALETANTAASTLKAQVLKKLAQTRAQAPAAAAGPPHVRVVVAEALDLPPTLDEFHAKVRAALEGLVRDQGIELVSAPPGSAARCNTRDCLQELALNVGATDVLIIAGSRNDDQGFALALQLWNAGREESEKAEGVCNFCTGAQMTDTAATLAKPLLAHLAAQVRAASGPAGAAAAPAGAPPEGELRPSVSRILLGSSLIAAGAAAITVGAITWHRVGEMVDCNGGQVCKLGGRNYGIGLVAGGAAAAIVGGALLIWGVTYRGAQVAIGPSSLAIAGSF